MSGRMPAAHCGSSTRQVNAAPFACLPLTLRDSVRSVLVAAACALLPQSNAVRSQALAQDPPSFRVFVPLGHPDAEPVRDLLIRASSSNSTSPPRDGGIKITGLLGDQAGIARQKRDTSHVALGLSEHRQLVPQILTLGRALPAQPVSPIGHR